MAQFIIRDLEESVKARLVGGSSYRIPSDGIAEKYHAPFDALAACRSVQQSLAQSTELAYGCCG